MVTQLIAAAHPCLQPASCSPAHTATNTQTNDGLQVTAEAGKYLVEQFLVHGLVAAVALPMTVMSAANLIDTWWSVCLDRAEKAGKLLAHVLMSGAHGDRCLLLHSSCCT